MFENLAKIDRVMRARRQKYALEPEDPFDFSYYVGISFIEGSFKH